MIDDEKTFKERGYRSTDLTHGSTKLVWAICEGERCEREGGRGRWVHYSQYTPMCHSCAFKKYGLVKKEDQIEKLPWVDDEKTFKEKGYRSTDCKPKSHRLVWAICANPNCMREGGRGRWVEFGACHELCNLCAHQTQEFRDAAHNNASRGENNPRYGKRRDTATRKKISATHQGIPYEEWEEFISFGKYCSKFNDRYKETIREKFGRKCFMCGISEEDTGQKLDVHHVNYNKNCGCDETACVCVPMCRRCHAKTNKDREMWARMITNKLLLEGWI